MAKKFLQNFDTFSIVQAVVAIIVLGTMAYMLVADKPIPTDLWTIIGVVVGFFFGGVSSNVIRDIKGE